MGSGVHPSCPGGYHNDECGGDGSSQDGIHSQERCQAGTDAENHGPDAVEQGRDDAYLVPVGPINLLDDGVAQIEDDGPPAKQHQ